MLYCFSSSAREGSGGGFQVEGEKELVVSSSRLAAAHWFPGIHLFVSPRPAPKLSGSCIPRHPSWLPRLHPCTTSHRASLKHMEKCRPGSPHFVCRPPPPGIHTAIKHVPGGTSTARWVGEGCGVAVTSTPTTGSFNCDHFTLRRRGRLLRTRRREGFLRFCRNKNRMTK